MKRTTSLFSVEAGATRLVPGVSAAITHNALNTASLFYGRQQFYSSTSRFPYTLTPRMHDAVGIMQDSMGKALTTEDGTVVYSFDFDGTLGHTKEAHHRSFSLTHKEFFGEEPGHDENETMHKVDGDPEVVFPRYFGENGEAAYQTFSVKMDHYYPATVTPMPGAKEFLKAVDIPRKHGLAQTAVVSFMEHNRLNRAIDAIGFRGFLDTVEGTKKEGADKTAPEMFTKRVYPALFGSEGDFMKRYAAWAEKEYGPAHDFIFGNHANLIRALKLAIWPQGLAAVLHFGDSRTTDWQTAESVPHGKGAYIAYNKGKPGAPADRVEMDFPHVPEWKLCGTDMFLTAAIEAVEKYRGKSHFSRQEEDTLYKELWVQREALRKEAGWVPAV